MKMTQIVHFVDNIEGRKPKEALMCPTLLIYENTNFCFTKFLFFILYKS